MNHYHSTPAENQSSFKKLEWNGQRRSLKTIRTTFWSNIHLNKFTLAEVGRESFYVMMTKLKLHF